MVQENYAGIIRSWNKQQNFNTGPVVDDKLAPVTYGRIKTLYGHTWREEQLSSIGELLGVPPRVSVYRFFDLP